MRPLHNYGSLVAEIANVIAGLCAENTRLGRTLLQTGCISDTRVRCMVMPLLGCRFGANIAFRMHGALACPTENNSRFTVTTA
jgi:hypothetical protein